MPPRSHKGAQQQQQQPPPAKNAKSPTGVNDWLTVLIPTYKDFNDYRNAFTWYKEYRKNNAENQQLLQKRIDAAFLNDRSPPIAPGANGEYSFSWTQLDGIGMAHSRLMAREKCGSDVAWQTLRKTAKKRLAATAAAAAAARGQATAPLTPLTPLTTPTPLTHSTAASASSSATASSSSSSSSSSASTPAVVQQSDGSTSTTTTTSTTTSPSTVVQTAATSNKRKRSGAAAASAAPAHQPLVSMFAVTLPVFSRAVELTSPQRGPEPRGAQLSDAIQIEGMEWRVRPIEADGLCWLRTIAAVVRPDLAKGALTQYLGVVRADLQAEIQRWQRPRWLQDVPWYGVRDWLWETRQEGDMDSFDVCVRLLQQSKEWFSHAVFYLASARYAIDFFLVGIRTHPPAGSPHPLYGRRINLPAIARIKVAVWHSGDHYEPLELPAEHAATVFEQISLLPTVSTNGSRCLDHDKLLLEGEGFQANKRQAVDLAAAPEVKADGVEHGADGADGATSLGVVQRTSSEVSHDFSFDDIRAPPEEDTTKASLPVLTVCRRQSDQPKQRPDFLQQTPPPKKPHKRATEPYWNDAVNKACNTALRRINE